MSDGLQIKTAPNSKESEMMVLGSMLTSVNGLNVAADQLSDFDFYYKEHQKIFKALKTAYFDDKPADIHLIAEELKRQNNLEDVGGIAYLTTLAQYVGTSAYIEEYVELVRDKSLLRKMITASEKIEKDALNEPKDVHKTLDDAQAVFFNISQSINTSQGKEIKDVLSGVKAESKLPYLKELQQRQERFHELGEEDPGITGEPTHYNDLDNMINGLGASNLLIVAARPAMGKTAFCVNIAENVCFKNKTPVAIFSLEMSADQLLHRVICSQAEVESDKVRTGSLSGVEFQRIVSTVKKMQEHTMIIDDQPGLKVTDLRARARRMKEVYNIGLIVVDYLQLLSGSSGNSVDNRQGEISEISRLLKNTARELNIPIICASQLSRKVEERQGHRPMMSDLRESGSIEQDADLVMFLLRREYYDPYDKPGLAEVIVAKNRHGKVGSIEMAYRKEFTQFANYTPVESSDDDENAFAAFSPEQ
ncbi:MAG: Replicative DNA helicase [Chlamydiia bacterium]|nr:Replicative DNA helicase [Chlamydiia bacterium]